MKGQLNDSKRETSEANIKADNANTLANNQLLFLNSTQKASFLAGTWKILQSSGFKTYFVKFSDNAITVVSETGDSPIAKWPIKDFLYNHVTKKLCIHFSRDNKNVIHIIEKSSEGDSYQGNEYKLLIPTHDSPEIVNYEKVR